METVLNSRVFNNFEVVNKSELSGFEGGTNWGGVGVNLVGFALDGVALASCATPVGAALVVGAAAIHAGLTAGYCYGTVD